MYGNIEKSAFHKGAYVGYAPLSGAWHIAKIGNGWMARNKTKRDPLGYVIRRTLREVSYELRTR